MWFLKIAADQRGVAAIEYGLIAALIALGLIEGLTALGAGAGGMWFDIEQQVQNSM